MLGNVVQNVGKAGINGALAAGITRFVYPGDRIQIVGLGDRIPLFMAAGLVSAGSEFMKTQISVLSSAYAPEFVNNMIQPALPVAASVVPIALLSPRVVLEQPFDLLKLGGIIYVSDLIADEILKRLPASVVGEVRVDGTQAV